MRIKEDIENHGSEVRARPSFVKILFFISTTIYRTVIWNVNNPHLNGAKRLSQKLNTVLVLTSAIT